MSGELVCVLDDDGDLAASVGRLLVRNGYETTVHFNAVSLLAQISRIPSACVITDVSMPRMGGFAVADAIRSVDSGVAIIFMTGWVTTRDAVDAIRRHGGLDYLDKPIDPTRLLNAVAEGVGWSKSRRHALDRLAPLTPRERSALELLVKGYSNKLVAAKLGLSVRTVDDHRAAIMRKTATRNISELAEILADFRGS